MPGPVMMKTEPRARTHWLHVAAIVAVVAELGFAYITAHKFATFFNPGAISWMLAFVLYSVGTVVLCIYSARRTTGWARFILPTIATIVGLYPPTLTVLIIIIII